jgi:sterol desaturase/sphingolipid hydroxylase (fatty acid hydroxylase superfamily)
MTFHGLIANFVNVVPFLLLIAVGIMAERWRPIEAQPASSAPLNLLYLFFMVPAQTLLAPLAAAAVAVIVQAAGGGLIELPAAGWLFLPSAIIFLLVMDFAEYAFHRLQHAIPFLWAMHSYHHSDTTLNATTTLRHFWAETSLKTVTVYLLPALLFKANGAVYAFYGIAALYNVFPHMNLRLGFGRWSWLLNSPHYHRLHHSALPEHYDCNFAALFPAFDVLFRTYRQPRPDEYPPTGIEAQDRPAGIIEAFCWPARGLLRRLTTRAVRT